MKLSEMSADHVFDTLGVAGEELGAIFEDADLTGKLEFIREKKDGESVSAFGLRSVKDLFFILNSLSKTHRAGIYRIVAEFKQISEEEVGKLSIPELWDQIRDSLNDELFLGFFPQLGPWVGKSLIDILSKPDPAKPASSSDTLDQNTGKTLNVNRSKKSI